jgi:UDP-glucose 4-epimerase
MKKKVIFITGVAGMLGSELLEKLIEDNKIIIGIDNFKLGKKIYIRKYISNKNFYFFNINLSKPIINSRLDLYLKKNKLEEIWLLAANSDIQKGISNPDEDFKNTFMTTYNTLNYLGKFLKKNTKLIFASSSAIFGSVKQKISEKTPANYPESNYGSMKLASESYIASYAKNHLLKSFIFRFPNVVGKNLTHGILYDFRKKFLSKQNVVQVLGNGNQKKPYSFSSEILDSMKYISNLNFKTYINYFNLGPKDNGIYVKDIVKIFKKKFKLKKIKYQKSKTGWKGDIVTYSYDTRKVNNLGYNFKYSSKQSILKSFKTLFN